MRSRSSYAIVDVWFYYWYTRVTLLPGYGPEYESRFGAAELGPVPTGGLRFGAATGPHDGVHVFRFVIQTVLCFGLIPPPPPPRMNRNRSSGIRELEEFARARV